MTINLLFFGSTGHLAKTRILPAIKILEIPAICFGRNQEKFDYKTYPTTKFFKHHIGDELPKNITIPYREKPIYMLLEAFNFDSSMIQGFIENAKEIQDRYPSSNVILLIDKPVGSSKDSFMHSCRDINMFEHYFIDHYLYKFHLEKVDNLKEIEIYYEDLPVPHTRKEFFVGAGGVIGDMFQSHFLTIIRSLILGTSSKDMKAAYISCTDIKRVYGVIIEATVKVRIEGVRVMVYMSRRSKKKILSVAYSDGESENFMSRRTTDEYFNLLLDITRGKTPESVVNVKNNWEITDKIVASIK